MENVILNRQNIYLHFVLWNIPILFLFWPYHDTKLLTKQRDLIKINHVHQPTRYIFENTGPKQVLIFIRERTEKTLRKWGRPFNRIKISVVWFFCCFVRALTPKYKITRLSNLCHGRIHFFFFILFISIFESMFAVSFTSFFLIIMPQICSMRPQCNLFVVALSSNIFLRELRIHLEDFVYAWLVWLYSFCNVSAYMMLYRSLRDHLRKQLSSSEKLISFEDLQKYWSQKRKLISKENKK